MGWLIELLFGAIRELCSQFIIDMMDISSGMFTEILSCDLNLFEGLFGVAESLYRNAIMPIGIALLLMILVWQLFKSMFGRTGTSSEDPIELVFRSCFCLFMIAFAKDLVNYVLELAGTPYQWITGTSITVGSFSEYISVSEAAVSVLGADALSIQFLLLILHFVVAWNYFKLMFILAERYVLLGVFSYTAPLAFATGGSKATNNILASWTKMFGGQVLIVLLDAWCVKMFLSAYGNLMASGYGFTKFFAATLCMIGFCKITAKLDSYMGSLGVNLGRITGGMSGLGAMMMAGRMMHGGTRLFGAGGGQGSKAGTVFMNFGGGKTIPMGKGGPDFADGAGNAGMSGVAVAAMDGNKDSWETPETADLSEAMGAEAGLRNGDESLESPFLPFGDPDALENDMDEMGENEVTGGILMSSEEEEQPFSDRVDMEGDGIPAMGQMENGSFDGAYGIDEQGLSDIPDAGEEWKTTPEEGQVTGSYSSGAGMEAAPDSEIPMETGGIGAAGTYQGISEFSGDGHTEQGISGSSQESSITEAGGSVDSGNEVLHMQESSMKSNEYESSANGEMSGTGVAAAMETGMGGFTGIDGNTRLGSSGFTEESRMEPSGGMKAGNGVFLSEHDGGQYMRYDASRFEKPQGEYKTVHENGKTFYELPKGEKAPEILPQTKAVLEKSGKIRLEQIVPEQKKGAKPRKSSGRTKKGGKKQTENTKRETRTQ
ncbi:hypothetical protein ACTM9N_03050 [Lachnospiraceae bacterium HCP1S3_A8]